MSNDFPQGRGRETCRDCQADCQSIEIIGFPYNHINAMGIRGSNGKDFKLRRPLWGARLATNYANNNVGMPVAGQFLHTGSHRKE